MPTIAHERKGSDGMSEGDLWVSVVGTVHIEANTFIMSQPDGSSFPFPETIYYCGMVATEKHRKVGSISKGFFISGNQKSCSRCHSNRDKGLRSFEGTRLN